MITSGLVAKKACELGLQVVTNKVRKREWTVYVLREAQRAIYTWDTSQTLDTSTLTIIPLTPPLKCNMNAMTLHLESELSTRLKRNKKKIHPSLKSWYRRSVQLLEHVDVENDLLHKRVSPSLPYFSEYPESSQTSTSTPQTWVLLWRLWTRQEQWDVPNQPKIKPQLQDGKAVILSWWWLRKPLGDDV